MTEAWKAKQMVKERQDITGSDCLKGVLGKVIVDEKWIKDSWKEYMEKLVNEENEWDRRMLYAVKLSFEFYEIFGELCINS